MDEREYDLTVVPLTSVSLVTSKLIKASVMVPNLWYWIDDAANRLTPKPS